MRVPLLDLRAQYAPIRDEITSAVTRVMDSQRFVLGPELEAFEDEMAAYCGCKYAVGVSSGTDALLVALMAIDLRPGDEVISSPYTFLATASSIARLGGTPVFVDIDPKTYNIDSAAIESRISPRTRAVIPVHLFGQMADMRTITDIARRRGLVVIEDAAQAIGAEIDGQRAGASGRLGCFSFYPSKNLGAFGDAGMVTTSDAALAERLRKLRNHGFRTKYDSDVLSGNFRMDEIQAAVLRVKLKYLDAWTAARRRNAGIYREYLQRPNPVELPFEQPNSKHVYNQFVVRSARRDELMRRLQERGIGCEVYYPTPLHLQSCFSALGQGGGSFPEAERAARESLALPVYAELTTQMIASVCSEICR